MAHKLHGLAHVGKQNKKGPLKGGDQKQGNEPKPWAKDTPVKEGKSLGKGQSS